MLKKSRFVLYDLYQIIIDFNSKVTKILIIVKKIKVNIGIVL